VPPPRDHLRIEKDGRLINCAPAPQLPDRRVPGNGQQQQLPQHQQQQQQQIAQIVEPTLEQSVSIKKYQVSYNYLYLSYISRHFLVAPVG